MRAVPQRTFPAQTRTAFASRSEVSEAGLNPYLETVQYGARQSRESCDSSLLGAYSPSQSMPTISAMRRVQVQEETRSHILAQPARVDEHTSVKQVFGMVGQDLWNGCGADIFVTRVTPYAEFN